MQESYTFYLSSRFFPADRLCEKELENGPMREIQSSSDTSTFGYGEMTLSILTWHLSCILREHKMGMPGFLWLFAKRTITGLLIGVTISDRLLSFAPVNGSSMQPTFMSHGTGLFQSLRGDVLLVEKLCLDKYKFSRGDVIIFCSPSNHKQTCVKRLVALPGEWINIPESHDVLQIPEGHCWVEGDNSVLSLDSRSFGPIPMGLIKGRGTHLIWPPQRMGKLKEFA